MLDSAGCIAMQNSTFVDLAFILLLQPATNQHDHVPLQRILSRHTCQGFPRLEDSLYSSNYIKLLCLQTQTEQRDKFQHLYMQGCTNQHLALLQFREVPPQMCSVISSIGLISNHWHKVTDVGTILVDKMLQGASLVAYPSASLRSYRQISTFG